MNRVLITGGAGFIGGHLATALADRGHEVTVVDNFARGVRDGFLTSLAERPNVTLVSADLMAPVQVAALPDDNTHIFHLAAIIGVRHVLERPYSVLVDNVRMLANAVELARRQSGLRRFLFASTSEVMAGSLIHMNMPVPTPEDFPLALTDLSHPRTSYMLSKIYGEAMVHHAGVPFTLFRPHNVYGPRMGMSHVLPELMKKARSAAQGGILEVASVEHRRAFCYVDDAVEQLMRLAEAEAATGGTFNIGNDTAESSIGDVASVVLETVGRTDLQIRALPATPGSPERRAPDMTRTNEVTGYQPRVGLAEGAARTWAWYAENVFSGREESAL
jgi:UDP-glucose 4-epimerase